MENINMTRKAFNLDEVTAIVTEKEINEVVPLNTLATFLAYSVQEHGYGLLGEYLVDMPQIHILVIDGVRLLVDTQGYNYPRYTARIK